MCDSSSSTVFHALHMKKCWIRNIAHIIFHPFRSDTSQRLFFPCSKRAGWRIINCCGALAGVLAFIVPNEVILWFCLRNPFMFSSDLWNPMSCVPPIECERIIKRASFHWSLENNTQHRVPQASAVDNAQCTSLLQWRWSAVRSSRAPSTVELCRSVEQSKVQRLLASHHHDCFWYLVIIWFAFEYSEIKGPAQRVATRAYHFKQKRMLVFHQ